MAIILELRGDTSLNLGETRTYTVSVSGDTPGVITYAWSVSGTAEIEGASNSNAVSVDAVGVPGNYTLTATVTRGGITVSTSVTVQTDFTTPPPPPPPPPPDPPDPDPDPELTIGDDEVSRVYINGDAEDLVLRIYIGSDRVI